MRSDRHEYKDFKDKKNFNFYRLDWFFDENIDFCDEIFEEPTAVVLLRSRDTFNSFRDDYIFEVYFIEFYGLKHKFMKITFKSSSEKYSVEKRTVGHDSTNEFDNIDVLHCKPHPTEINPEPIPCMDYPQEEGYAQHFTREDIFIGIRFSSIDFSSGE